MADDNESNNKAGNYKHLYVVIEHFDGSLVPVSLEMLGEARRLMDDYNLRYGLAEKVVAVLLGFNVRILCETLISHGADIVVYADNKELQYSRNTIDTKVIAQIARDKEIIKKISPEYYESYIKPRYMFFAADNIGRHLSSTVLVELDSGLASDINKLVISDLDIRHEHKTKGQSITYAKTLEMYRPDFSGFLWTTILCLDNKNPETHRDYHPQACSIIPSIFKPIKNDEKRRGIIIDYTPIIDSQDLKTRILNRSVIKKTIEFDNHKIILGFGRGIKNNPEENIKLIEELAGLLNSEIGISLPLSKRPYHTNDNINSKFLIPDRVIGTSGAKINPSLYIAIGISGAMQHIVGIKDSEFVIAINPDENASIRDECDLFVKGRMEEVLPKIIKELQEELNLQEVNQIGAI